MQKTQVKIGGIFGGGFGYEYDTSKKYITFKDDGDDELFSLDYFNLGKKFYWTYAEGIPPYEDYTFERYDTKEQGLNSDEAAYYLKNGYTLKQDEIVRVITYLKSQMSEGNRLMVLGEPHKDYYCPLSILHIFLEERVANDIREGKGIEIEGGECKTISYYEEPVRYSVVVAVDGYAVDVTNGILEKDIQNELEYLKGRTSFHIVEGSQIDDKVVGKIWEE